MPSNTHPNHGKSLPQTVHVAVYEHRHGTDIRVFLYEDQAMEWRTSIAKEWWSSELDAHPPPDNEIGAEYFEIMADRGEFFLVQKCDLEVDQRDQTDPPPKAGGAA